MIYCVKMLFLDRGKCGGTQKYPFNTNKDFQLVMQFKRSEGRLSLDVLPVYTFFVLKSSTGLFFLV